MGKDIHYMLERYRPGGTNRYTCPFCGRKKCFTRYVDVETGEYLADECGKCNHENSCPVKHYPPHEYFHDHPEALPNREFHPLTNGTPTILVTKKNICIPIKVEQTEFYDMAWAEIACKRTSTFRIWFEGLPFDSERIREVWQDYLVGATKEDIRIGGINYGPAAVFWMIDEQGRVHDGKMIAYSCDGHRIEGWGEWVRSAAVKKKLGPQIEHTVKVLFGLHLLKRYPDKVVCIVESEKTALICACHYPEHLWMATGGCGNLQAEKLRPLMNRRIVVFPDSGEYKKWCEQMQLSGHKNYYVEDFLEQYPGNTDIADLIIEELKTKKTE